MKDIDVIFKDEILTLTRFWGNNKWCLWITAPSQIGMPKMEFVGGYPNEYCIFLENLSLEELQEIRLPNGQPLDLKKVTGFDSD
ncbi:MAG: hypothetical protein Q4D65_00965 [Peptostreptococcaceae bacterium]|nr:hypothetical protein [Peptostreptococcaceae bacterium]